VANHGDEWIGGGAHEAFGLRLPVEADCPWMLPIMKSNRRSTSSG
jgi:hypothetical protein